MSKLSKQDKIEIFNLWQNYQIGATELSRCYQVCLSTINYLLALINRYGTAILDRPYASYSISFKEQAIRRRVLVKDEAIYQVALDLGLKIKESWLIGCASTVKIDIISLPTRKCGA